MKGIIYQCETCHQWTEDLYSERWVEVSSASGNTRITRAQRSIIKIERDKPLHFCSIRCLLEYIVKQFNSGDEIIGVSDAITELIEGNKPIEIGNVKISPIGQFKLELEAHIPGDIWCKQVKELGLNPDDFVVSDTDGDIINVYKAYYTSNNE